MGAFIEELNRHKQLNIDNKIGTNKLVQQIIHRSIS